MLGPSRNAVVKLCADEDVTVGLGLAEGLETALTVLGNFAFAPIWAALSAGTIATFPF